MSSRFCEHCGAELPSDAVFCEACGAKAAAITAPAAPARPQAYRQPEQAQKYKQPVPPQKKSGSKSGLILLALVLIAAVIVAVLWFAGVIGGGKPGGGTPDTPPVQTVKPIEKPNTQPVQTVEPSSAEADNEDDPGVNEDPAQLSTTETPAPEDFTWFTDRADRWIYGITPIDASMLEDFYDILGSWKGMSMIYDTDGTLLGSCYFTATFDESGPNIAAAIDWCYIDWDDGSRDELGESDALSMTGSFAEPTLALGEEGNRMELILYSMNGKQYAEGVWTVEDDEEARVALVRP